MKCVYPVKVLLELERVDVQLPTGDPEPAQGGHGDLDQAGWAAEEDIPAAYVRYQRPQAVRGEEPAGSGIVPGTDHVPDPRAPFPGQSIRLVMRSLRDLLVS